VSSFYGNFELNPAALPVIYFDVRQYKALNKKERAMVDRSEFLYPRSRYYGKVKPENLVFNANLQEFAQQVGYICNLETAGKISPEDSYKKIHQLWKQLKRTKKQLRIGENSFKLDNENEENEQG
jgi:hypothetical protein